MVIPLVRKLPHKEQDTGNLISLLSTPIDCKLTLGELLKIHPHLWNKLAAILEKMGVKEIKPKVIKMKTKPVHKYNWYLSTKWVSTAKVKIGTSPSLLNIIM